MIDPSSSEEESDEDQGGKHQHHHHKQHHTAPSGHHGISAVSGLTNVIGAGSGSNSLGSSSLGGLSGNIGHHNSSTSDYGSAGGGSSGHGTPPSRGKNYASGEADMRPHHPSAPNLHHPMQQGPQFGSHAGGGAGGAAGGLGGGVGGGSTKDVYMGNHPSQNSGHVTDSSAGNLEIPNNNVVR